MSGRPILEIEEVSFDYGERPAVRDVSLALHRGRISGLLGPNGSGKSTVLRLAAGLLVPRAGEVRLDGQDLRGMERGAIARRIAVAPQQAPMPEAFTGWEVAMAGRTPYLGLLRGATMADEAIVSRALALAGAEELADRRVGELSGGERQRLVLARALAQEPEVLLLDEPTTHLDLPHQIDFLDLVLRFAREGDLAVLVVFHDLNLASTYCDEIALMRGGAVVTRGEPGDVLTPGWIEAVYDLTVPVVPHPVSGRPVVLLPAAPDSDVKPPECPANVKAEALAR